MKFRVILALTVFLTCLASLMAQHGEGPRGPRHMRHMPDRIIQGLDLSEEQVAQLRQLREEHRTTSRDLRDQQRQLRRDLRDALEAEAPSAQLVGELTISLHNLKTSFREANQALKEGFKELLTPEQQEKLDEFGERRGSRLRGRLGRR